VPFGPEDKAALEAMIKRPPDQRTKLHVGMRAAQGRRYRMEGRHPGRSRDPDRSFSSFTT